MIVCGSLRLNYFVLLISDYGFLLNLNLLSEWRWSITEAEDIPLDGDSCASLMVMIMWWHLSGWNEKHIFSTANTSTCHSRKHRLFITLLKALICVPTISQTRKWAWNGVRRIDQFPLLSSIWLNLELAASLTSLFLLLFSNCRQLNTRSREEESP